MLLDDVIYIIFSKGYMIESKSYFRKHQTISELLSIFSQIIDERILRDEMSDDEAFTFKEEMLSEMTIILSSHKKDELYGYLERKSIIFNWFKIIKNIILTDESDLDILVENEEDLYAFLKNFPDMYYETLSDANELLGSFNINYNLKFLFEEDGYLMGVYDGIVTTVEIDQFDGSTPYLKYYEFGVEDKETHTVLNPRYVFFSPDKHSMEI